MAQRLDKWLVYARFVKHRSAATQMIENGDVRVNRIRVQKTSHVVKEQDVLTIAIAGRVRVVKVRSDAERRGSAAVAGLLYEELLTGLTQPGPAEKADASPGSVC
jgi:ribosome-associated heat shock protein Hsp15